MCAQRFRSDMYSTYTRMKPLFVDKNGSRADSTESLVEVKVKKGHCVLLNKEEIYRLTLLITLLK